MRARDLAEPFPVVHLDTDAMEATRLLVDRALPGLVVVDRDGLPLFILPGSQVLRFALPDYVEEDRTLASVYSESDADALCESLRGRTVQELMPSTKFLPRSKAPTGHRRSRRHADGGRGGDGRAALAGRCGRRRRACHRRHHRAPPARRGAARMTGLLAVSLSASAESAQTAEHSASTLVVVLAVVIFVGTYVLIATEWVHRVAAALVGAALMVVIGATDAESAFFSEDTAVDWNVVFLLLGMMIIIGVLKQTGLFEYLAIWAAKRARGRPFAIMAMLCTITAVASALLPNVTTVMLVAPVTLLVCDRLRVRPEGFLIALVMASNIGGTATLIGDPPNLIIASRGDLSFNDFLIHLTPFIVVAFVAFVLLSRWLFRESFSYDPERVEAIMRIDERRAIRDPALLRRSLAVLALVILGFVLGTTIDVAPSLVALLGAGLLVVVSRTATADYLEEVEWPTLIFFMGLFVMVGALVDVGVIDTVGEAAIEAVGDDYLLAATGLLFGSAALSAIIDNIPYVATVAPLVADLVDAGEGAPEANALWWALALGADLGGNATAVGASANVVALGIAERNGFPISFWRFTRYGVVVTVVTVALAWPYLYLRYYAFG